MSRDFFQPGKWVLRNDRPYQLPDFNNDRLNAKAMKAFYDLQTHGETFKPLVRIQTVPESTCVSCEG